MSYRYKISELTTTIYFAYITESEMMRRNFLCTSKQIRHAFYMSAYYSRNNFINNDNTITNKIDNKIIS